MPKKKGSKKKPTVALSTPINLFTANDSATKKTRTLLEGGLLSRGKMSPEAFMDRVDRILELGREASDALVRISANKKEKVFCIDCVDTCITAITSMSAEVEKVEQDLKGLRESFDQTDEAYQKKNKELMDDYENQFNQLKKNLGILKSKLKEENPVESTLASVQKSLSGFKDTVIQRLTNVVGYAFGYGKWPLQKKEKVLTELNAKIQKFKINEKLVRLDTTSSTNLVRVKKDAERATEGLLREGWLSSGKMSRTNFSGHVDNIRKLYEEVKTMFEHVNSIIEQEGVLKTEDIETCVDHIDRCMEKIVIINAKISEIEEDLRKLGGLYSATSSGYQQEKADLAKLYNDQIIVLQSSSRELKKELRSKVGANLKKVETSLATVTKNLSGFGTSLAQTILYAAENIFGCGKWPVARQKAALEQLQTKLEEMQESSAPVRNTPLKH